MAEVNAETIDGDTRVAVYLSPDECKLICTTWDLPLEFKKALIQAAETCQIVNGD